MEFDHKNMRLVVEEDRLSSLPDELIHKILSSFDMKFVVQTSVLSSRWEFLWTSMPCLNFNNGHFGNLANFAKFVKDVLSHRNHQVEVSSVKLDFHGSSNQVFVRKIAKYAFSHNVQQLTIVCHPRNQPELPPCLFSSRSLKHFTLSTPLVTPRTPWDFPSLTTLHLSRIRLCDENSEKPVDLCSKCVNLKKLTLERFTVKAVDIITPRLSSLMLIDCSCSEVMNVIAPQLENLTVKDCDIKYLNAPPGISSLCYTDPKWYHDLVQFSKHGFHSLNKVSVCLPMSNSLYRAYKEKYAQRTIKLLQQLHSARYLTLNVDVIECLSLFPDLVAHHPSPLSNLICLTIDSSRRIDAYKVKMSTEVRNFLLDNSPNATFIMELPAKVKRAAEIDSHLMELEALIDSANTDVKRKQAKQKANAALEKLMAELNLPVGKWENTKIKRLKAKFIICVKKMRALIKEEKTELKAIISKEAIIKLLLENMPKQERTEVEAYFSRQLQETHGLHERLVSKILASGKIFAYKKLFSDCFSTYQDSKLTLTSPSSRSIPTPSTSNLNPMPGASQE